MYTGLELSRMIIFCYYYFVYHCALTILYHTEWNSTFKYFAYIFSAIGKNYVLRISKHLRQFDILFLSTACKPIIAKWSWPIHREKRMIGCGSKGKLMSSSQIDANHFWQDSSKIIIVWITLWIIQTVILSPDHQKRAQPTIFSETWPLPCGPLS